MKQEKTTIEEYLFLLVYGVWFLLGNLYITFWTRSLPVRDETKKIIRIEIKE